KGRLPVAQQIYHDMVFVIVGDTAGRDAEQRHCDAKLGQHRKDAQDNGSVPVLVAQHQHERADDHRDGDRQDGKMVHPLAHCDSVPSTWSVLDRPRNARMTTRNKAVVAKLMTMAVSTSAWGRGSA